MKMILSSATAKILEKKDCVEITNGKCLVNESYAFQLYIQSDENLTAKVQVDSALNVNVYREVKKRSLKTLEVMNNDWYRSAEDEWYLSADDDMYPDLLLRGDTVDLDSKEPIVLFFEIPAEGKTEGVYSIKISVNGQEIAFTLEVLKERLVKTDLILTHWMHFDGICNYYKVEPFSEEFYVYFKRFLKSYVKMGNTMLLVPVFTPPLDTQVGGERLTTQLVGVKKEGEIYAFDFEDMKKYIRLALDCGIEYFEISHLFTQWGGTACPKIIVEENGEKKKAFGWDCSSLSDEYCSFLRQFLGELVATLKDLGVKDKTYIHLTDEPSADHIETYEKLYAFVKSNIGDMKTMDALSKYAFAERGVVDLPVVITGSEELDKFADRDILLYYCVCTDGNYLSNRYFHMPSLRTVVLGLQLYQTGVQGFLHWGYNFYNTQFSLASVNPYEETMAGEKFIAGDSFLVYPGEQDVDYSLRYFSMMQAFEDYRLLKTVENRIGREKVVAILNEYGFYDLHNYTHDCKTYIALKEKLYSYL